MHRRMVSKYCFSYLFQVLYLQIVTEMFHLLEVWLKTTTTSFLLIGEHKKYRLKMFSNCRVVKDTNLKQLYPEDTSKDCLFEKIVVHCTRVRDVEWDAEINSPKRDCCFLRLQTDVINTRNTLDCRTFKPRYVCCLLLKVESKIELRKLINNPCNIKPLDMFIIYVTFYWWLGKTKITNIIVNVYIKYNSLLLLILFLYDTNTHTLDVTKPGALGDDSRIM